MRRRAYKNIVNIPSAMQAIEVVLPYYTSNRLLPTKVGMTRTSAVVLTSKTFTPELCIVIKPSLYMHCTTNLRENGLCFVKGGDPLPLKLSHQSKPSTVGLHLRRNCTEEVGKHFSVGKRRGRGTIRQLSGESMCAHVRCTMYRCMMIDNKST